MTETTVYEYATMIRAITEAGLRGELIVRIIDDKIKSFGALLDDGTTVHAEQFSHKWLGYLCSPSGRPSPRRYQKRYQTAAEALHAAYREHLKTTT